MSAETRGFLLLIDQQQHGPYSLEELQTGLREGWARPEDLIWGPGLTEWTSIASVPSLGGCADLPPPVPAPVATRRRSPLLWAGCLAIAGVLVLAAAFVGVVRLGWVNSPFGGRDRPESYDFEEIYASDTGDWRRYPDLETELEAIARRREKLVRTLRAGELDTAAGFVNPEDQEVWQSRTRAEPALAAALADALDTSVVSFLSVQPRIPDDPRSRTAGFVVTARGRRFEILWIKLDNTWFLYRY